MKTFFCTYIIIPIVILLAGCNGTKETNLTVSTAQHIVDFEQCMSAERTMRLTEIIFIAHAYKSIFFRKFV